MASTSDSRELWAGTPNQMGRIMTGTLGAVKTRAKTELSDRAKMADKFDHAAIGHINECREGVTGLTPLSFKNGPRVWTFPFIGITYRLEIR